MTTPVSRFEIAINNVKQGADYATREEADAAALAMRTADPNKQALVREVLPQR